jgi:hypothetical protein
MTLSCERLSAEAFRFHRAGKVIGAALYDGSHHGWRWHDFESERSNPNRKAFPTVRQLVRHYCGAEGVQALDRVCGEFTARVDLREIAGPAS